MAWDDTNVFTWKEFGNIRIGFDIEVAQWARTTLSTRMGSMIMAVFWLFYLSTETVVRVRELLLYPLAGWASPVIIDLSIMTPIIIPI